MPQLSPAECSRSSCRISSIWNDAVMFSISTHALMHPCAHTRGQTSACKPDAATVPAAPPVGTYAGQVERVLGPGEDLVPQASLQVVLHLGAVEEGPAARRVQRGAAVVDQQPVRGPGAGEARSRRMMLAGLTGQQGWWQVGR